MLRIAICDDKVESRNNIDKSLMQIETRWKTYFEISTFSSGKDLCENLKHNDYDIILLDVIMNGLNGIKTANKICSMDLESYIVFISNYDKGLQHLFGRKTLAFLYKPVNVDTLEENLTKVYNLIEREKDKNNVFVYSVNKAKKIEYFKNIIYFESTNKRIEMVTTKGIIIIYDTLKNIWNELHDNSEFLAPNRSFIINLRYATMDSISSLHIDKLNINIQVGRGL
ncbi:MAG: LytR/AlgR family response regulator transcription factor [Lachnospirales bacterium]